MRLKRSILFFVLTFSATVVFNSCRSVVRFSSNANTKVIFAEKNIDKIIDEENDIRQFVVKTAEKWIGTPYCWGGESTKCADCSGFVQSVFSSAGIALPRVSKDQYSSSVRISKVTAEPGDLVFFSNSSKIDHVGIYIGGNTMIHSSSSYGVIRQSLDTEYYQKRLAGFGRVIDLKRISCDYD
jgi:cell wall-associated NlpC family hydrolase